MIHVVTTWSWIENLKNFVKKTTLKLKVLYLPHHCDFKWNSLKVKKLTKLLPLTGSRPDHQLADLHFVLLDRKLKFSATLQVQWDGSKICAFTTSSFSFRWPMHDNSFKYKIILQTHKTNTKLNYFLFFWEET